MSRAASMWDPNVGLGTVTHQNIGYLFPMGPFYWTAEKLGLPMWLAQRIWLGSLLFFAGAGVWFLLRTLRWSTLPATVAAFAYALTPYTLTLEARLSGILLPFTGLPWMIALTIRAVRRGGWRDPALFCARDPRRRPDQRHGSGLRRCRPPALVPLRDLGHEGGAVAARRRSVRSHRPSHDLTSLWWMAGLSLQGAYGIDVLAYTETAKVVASAAVAPEVFRGLGYWFFYGGDRLGAWIEPGVDYTQRLWLITVTYLSPVFALVGAAVSRWKHRAYFVTLAAVGLFITVGAHPWDDRPSRDDGGRPCSRVLAARVAQYAARDTLVVLGLAVLLSAGIATLIRIAPRRRGPRRCRDDRARHRGAASALHGRHGGREPQTAR